MNTREILQTYGSIYNHLSDRKLFDKMAELTYHQIGHGVSFEYWKKAYGSKGYITVSNIRVHITNAINETGSYSDVAMAAGLKRYRRRKREEAEGI